MASSTASKFQQWALKSKIFDILIQNGITEEPLAVDVKIPEELKGEHFATESIYVQVTFREYKLNLFVKVFASNPVHQKIIKDLKVMETESSFYNEFLPFARNFCGKFDGAQNLLDFFPKCFYADNEMIVLENLVLDKGFQMLPMAELQDLISAKMVLTNLAKLHAVSYAVIQEVGMEEFTNKFTPNDTIMKSDFVNSFLASSCGNCITILKDYPKPGSAEALEFLINFSPDLRGKLASVLEASDLSSLVAVGHGDCWNNNMLFKVDPVSGNILHNVLLDFQSSRVASPIIDISRFLFTSVKPIVRRENLENLLLHYLEELKKTLGLLNQKCPINIQDLKNDYKSFCTVGFIFGLRSLSTVGALKGIDCEVMGTEEAYGMRAYNDALSQWIKQNPDKAEKIAPKIIDIVQEYRNLQLY